jgi:hypothetical protein
MPDAQTPDRTSMGSTSLSPYSTEAGDPVERGASQTVPAGAAPFRGEVGYSDPVEQPEDGCVSMPAVAD